MSWTMWHDEGEGFRVDGCTMEKYISFIKKHKSSLPDKCKDDLWEVCDKSLLENWDEDEFFSEIREGHTDFCSIAEPISLIMSQETGIRFGAPSMTEDGEEAVIFYHSYPWYYNDKEKRLTKRALVSMLKKYAKELGVEGTVDYIDLVYSG